MLVYYTYMHSISGAPIIAAARVHPAPRHPAGRSGAGGRGATPGLLHRPPPQVEREFDCLDLQRSAWREMRVCFFVALLLLRCTTAGGAGGPPATTIVANHVQPGGAPVHSVAQLQALLDARPGAVRVSSSRWTITNATVWLRSNRSLIMDEATTFEGTAEVPWTRHGAGQTGEGGGALVTVAGNNISLVGGRFVQEILPACAEAKVQPTTGACNFAVDIYYSSGVTFRDTVVEGSFMSAVRVQEGFWPDAIKPGAPPVSTDWVVLPGLAKQPVLITNVTLLHHRNESFFQLRGFWTVMASNVIFSRNTILGRFGYAIDLDSSSSANLVVNNYMKGCLWEGIFTEYSAVQNMIVGNTVIANTSWDQGIHLNGYLNMAVGNTVLMLDGKTPGGIACTSQLKMYSSYALSNRIVGNSCGRLSLGGDGGNDNWAAENTANVSVAGAASPSATHWFKTVNASSRIAGVDTAAAAVISDVSYTTTQSKACATGAPSNCGTTPNNCGPVPDNCGPRNPDLTQTIEIVANRVQSGGGGQSVATVAQLQALLDSHPNTVFKVSRSHWTIDTQQPKSIWLRSNRTLLMDVETVIESSVLVPSTQHKLQSGQVVTGYGALLTVNGHNVGVVGGKFLQDTQAISCNCCHSPGNCNFAIDVFQSSAVKLRDSVVQGSFGSSVRVQEGYSPAGIKPGSPPVKSEWVTLSGLAQQPVLITNVTILHHANASLFSLRGFWTVMATGVILTRNRVIGPFMYSIDLDSSSSGNLVHNNLCKGSVWEGIFTEYSATRNTITSNTVIGKVANNAHIHINGYLNVVVDNFVQGENSTQPGGISVTSQLKMYNSYALSNRIVGNSAAFLYFGGDGGCDNYAAGNRLDVGRPGSTVSRLGFPLTAMQTVVKGDCIAGVDSTLPVVVVADGRLEERQQQSTENFNGVRSPLKSDLLAAKTDKLAPPPGAARMKNDDGLARTPPLGWRSWNFMKEGVTQQRILGQVHALAARRHNQPSLLEVGYTHIGIDDGWQDCGRGVNDTFHDAQGTPIIARSKFPDMKGMVKEANSVGVEMGWCECNNAAFASPNLALNMNFYV